MELQEIEKLLSAEGYRCYYSDNELVGGIFQEFSELLNCELLSSTFSVKKQNGEVILDYTKAHVPKLKNFRDNQELINFIKSEFPIKT